ncbi:hypothetical protein [Actinoplanes sp. DH11]|uniref:hypothetical protein n=1 Tax=Actinoplanes sp. DH11 TaxID=2857011 RepID=UPI001E40F4ED|nr:hypothetical protein [Actinoplanes sp. DH11]
MRRVRSTPLLAILTLTAAGCGALQQPEGSQRTGLTGDRHTAGCAMARAPRHAVTGNVQVPLTPARLTAAMERIEEGGRERFAEHYSGMEIDHRGVRAVVYRVPSARFDGFVRSSAGTACVVVRDAAHAVAELSGWQDRVMADLPYWAEQGVRIVTVGSRHDGAGVEIGTQDIDEARRQLPARYGSAAPLVFVQEGPIPMLTSTSPTAPESVR